MKYHIISDGSCDLNPQEAIEKGIEVVPFYVSFDEQTYEKEIAEIGIRDFYEQMVQNPKVFPKSSMPSVQDFYDVFLPHVQAGEAVICICITTKFSGSLQSAMNAKNMMLETYPDAEITVVDSTLDTVLQGIYVLEAVDMRDKGIPYEKAVERLMEMRSSGRIFFTVGNIDYLQHGGRIGKLSGIASNVLNIKPLITLKEGEIFPSGIARGRKTSKEKVIGMLLSHLKELNAKIEDYSICVGFGYDYEEAVEFRDHAVEMLRANGYAIKEMPILQIGATISVHTGPYPLGFGFVERHGLK